MLGNDFTIFLYQTSMVGNGQRVMMGRLLLCTETTMDMVARYARKWCSMLGNYFGSGSKRKK